MITRTHGQFDVLFNSKPVGKIIFDLSGYAKDGKPVWAITAEWSGTSKKDHFFPRQQLQTPKFLALIQYKINTGDSTPLQVNYTLKPDGARLLQLPGSA